MKKFEELPTLAFPNGKFTDEKDQIVITGELHWVRHDVNHLDEDGKKKADVRISKADYQKLIKTKCEGGRKLCGVKKKMKKDEDGDDTDEVDYYVATMTQNAFVKDAKTGEEKEWSIPVRMFNDKKTQIEVGVGNGSLGRVKGSLWKSDFKDKKQMSLNLIAIQVYDLIPFTGGGEDSALDDFDFDDEPDFGTEEESAPEDFDEGNENDNQASNEDEDEDPFGN